MVTFTNASAGEMTDRIKKRLGPKGAWRTKSTSFASLMMAQFRQISKGRKSIIGPEQILFVQRAVIAEKQNIDEIDDWVSKVEETGRDVNYEFRSIPSCKVFNRYCEILHYHRRYDIKVMARKLIGDLYDGTANLYEYI